MIRYIDEEESSNVTKEEKNEYHFSIVNCPTNTDCIIEDNNQPNPREQQPVLANLNPQVEAPTHILEKFIKVSKKSVIQEIRKSIANTGQQIMNYSLVKSIPLYYQDEFAQPASVCDISDIRLVRWKNESKKDNEEEMMHGLLIKGRIIQTIEENENFIEEYKVSLNYFRNKSLALGNETLEKCLPLWVALGNFFNISKIMMSQVNKVLKNVRFSSLFVYVVHKVYQRDPQPKFDQISREVTVKDLLSEMPYFIQDCIHTFFDPIFKEYHNIINKDNINAINDLCLFDWHLIESQLKDFEIFSDLLMIAKNIQSNMFIKTDRLHLLENCRKDSNLNLSEIFFRIMLIKIEKFYKSYYPSCCGLKQEDDLDYSKAPYVICFTCQLLVCYKCFKFHRKHNYFDICTIIRNKKANIHSDMSNFLNSSKKQKQNKEKEIEEVKKLEKRPKKGEKAKVKKDKNNRVDKTPNFGQDLLLEDILKYLHSNVIQTLENFMNSQAKEKDNPIITLGIVDMMDIVMLEYLLKTIYPMAADNNYYIAKVEAILKNEIAENCFHVVLKRNYSNSCDFSLEWITLYRDRMNQQLQMEDMQKEVESIVQKTETDAHHNDINEDKKNSILHPVIKEKVSNLLFNRGDILKYFQSNEGLGRKNLSLMTAMAKCTRPEIGIKFEDIVAKASLTNSYKPLTNHLQAYFQQTSLDNPISFFPRVKYYMIEKDLKGTPNAKYVDGFGSLFEFILLYCENIYSQINSFGLIK